MNGFFSISNSYPKVVFIAGEGTAALLPCILPGVECAFWYCSRWVATPHYCCWRLWVKCVQQTPAIWWAVDLHICPPPRGGGRCSTQGIGEGLRRFIFTLLSLLGNSQIPLPQGCCLGQWEEGRVLGGMTSGAKCTEHTNLCHQVAHISSPARAKIHHYSPR